MYAKYIYKLLVEVIKEVGKENMVQIVTKNGRKFKKTREKLMNLRRYNLFWTPCVAHCIDLMLKDMRKLGTERKAVKMLR